MQEKSDGPWLNDKNVVVGVSHINPHSKKRTSSH